MNILSEAERVFFLIIYQFKLIFPYWMAGTLVGSVLSVYAAERIASLQVWLKKGKYGVFAILPAAVIGAASPVCMYGTVPLIASLGRKGVPQYLLAAFMVSSILINPNLFLLSFALGAPLAFIRLIACILAGILAGLTVKVMFKEKSFFSFEGFEERKKSCREGNQGIRLLKDIHRAVVKTAPYFLIGILLAALFQCYVPASFMTELFGFDKRLSVLFAATMGVPVYVCGGGTIPLLLVWLQGGMSKGSAIAFMISGAATKLTNLSAVKIILGIRNFLFYIVFNALFAIAAGLLADLVMS